MYQNYQDLVDGKQITPEQETEILTKINLICDKFKGSHNFHNYTVKISPKDDRAKRYIISMKAELINHDSNEQSSMKFVRFSLEGQSFIYH